LTHKICQELQASQGAGKRKRANVVTRTPDGEYLSAPAEPRPGDEHVDLEPEPVPDFLEDPVVVRERKELLSPVSFTGVRNVVR